MKTIKRIAKNAMLMFSANLVKKILTLFLTLIVARYLGVSSYGKMSLALSFVALFSILSDFGAKILINREIARNKDKVNKYVFNTIVMKLYASFFMVIVVLIVANLLDYPREILNLMYIATFMHIFQSLGEPLNSAFRAFEKLKYNAITLIAESLLNFLLAILVVFLGLGLQELMLSYLFADIISFLLRFAFYHYKIHKFHPEYDKEFSRKLLKASIPFGVAALLMTLYDKIDVAMLSKMVPNSDEVIGWYSVAYNFLYIFEFIPLSIGAAIYPYASIAYLKSLSKFKIIYRKLLTYYFYLTIPLSFGTVAVADKVIDLLYGPQYHGSVLALQILIWTVLFKYQIYAFGIVLNSMNKEKLTMKATMVSLLANIGLNLVLIPKYSYLGAAVATIAAELVYFVICYTAVSIYLEKVSLIRILYKPILASLLMVFIAFYLKDINFFISVVASLIVYLVLMYILKEFDKEDLSIMSRFIGQKFVMFRR